MQEIELKLDIACGKNKKAGFIGVDIWEKADIVCDLEKFPWPFADDSVDEIFCSHYIEHTPDLISFANELYRIMKVGAKAEIIAPYYSSIRAWQDPTHLRAISENTFLYLNREWRLMNRLDHYPITTDFDFKYHYSLDPDWAGKEDKEIAFAIRHYINVVSDINVLLIKRDPDNSRFQRVTDLWSSGDRDEAFKLCEQLVAQGETDCDLLLIIAEHYFHNEDYSTSIDTYLKILDQDVESLQANCGLVRAMNMAGRESDSQDHLVGLRKRDPEFADLVEEVISAGNH